jgi:leader peptidase (prepilin peptidase)/N-methyltransferase
LFVLIGSAFFREGLFISPALAANIVVCLAIAALLICIFVYDLYHMIIPDEWVFLFAALALLSSLFWHDQGTHALTIILAGPLAALPLYLMWLVSGGKWMGFGDPKLALGMGWLLGPVFGLVAVFLAFIIGALISVGILIPLSALQSGHKRITIKSEVPFGPFLIVSTCMLWLVILYGLQAPLLFLFS